jgi:sirohydrochlorin cobaltochelatase
VPDDEALLLVAHGSARYPDAGRVVQAQAARLRQAEPGRQVAVGLLNGAPSVAEAVATLTAPTVRVVPFFMEDGYFTRVAVPRALGGAAGRIRLCPPVGVHDGMAGLIAGCVRAGCTKLGLDPAELAVVVVGHGSARTPGRALALHRHAARVDQDGGFARVEAACLEEAPFLADVLCALRGQTIGVVGFFAGEGGHVLDDVPRLIAAEQAACVPGSIKIHNFGSAADNPGMTEIILAQARSG